MEEYSNLNQTGWMHNRLRMVVAMFLSKNLLIDWRLGEAYFMNRLIDGDHASNNGDGNGVLQQELMLLRTLEFLILSHSQKSLIKMVNLLRNICQTFNLFLQILFTTLLKI